MQAGKTLTELATEVDRQARTKKDFYAQSSALRLEASVEADVEDPSETPQRWQHTLEVEGLGSFQTKDTFHGQLSNQLGIPRKYYDRMREQEPELLADNVNVWFQHNDKRRLVRTLDSGARAYLSDKFRPLDNYDLCQVIIPAVQELGLDVVSCEVTERRMYIQAKSERITGNVKVDDIVQQGVVISNSEVGEGSLKVEDMLWRLFCLNGMVIADVVRKAHVGRGSNLDEAAQAYYRDATKAADDAAFFMKVKDSIAHVFEPEAFDVKLNVLRDVADIAVKKPSAAVEVVASRLQLTDGEKEQCLVNLIEDKDLSGWGLVNAVTKLAHTATDYDRAVELERAGQRVVELPKAAWQTIVDGVEAAAAA